MHLGYGSIVKRYMSVTIGTAGWSIPSNVAGAFDREGTALQRYASRLKGVEINSSFYRTHRPSTWTRWAESTPEDFRFSVKVPRAITHEHQLADCSGLMRKFTSEVSELGQKLAILLVQLPPKLGFEQGVVSGFFEDLSALTNARIVCEPRHLSWFEPLADRLLLGLGIARVAADPSLCPEASHPSGWHGVSYWRLHGSPRIYRSPYDGERLRAFADMLEARHSAGSDTWCIFDNTASGAAASDAIKLKELLQRAPFGVPHEFLR